MCTVSAKVTDQQIAKDLLETIVVHKNVGQEIIITTTDKIRISLDEYHKHISINGKLQTLLSLLSSLILSLLTTKTRDFMGISAETWEVFFIALASVTCGFFIVSLFRALKYRKKNIIDLIKELQGNDSPQ